MSEQPASEHPARKEPGVGEPHFAVIAESTLHEWAMFALVHRVVEDPSGASFDRSFVRTPGAVAAIAVDDNGHVLLVKQYRASLGQRILEIPAGMRDVLDEPPMETARRELMEETGYTAAQWSHLGTMWSAPGVTDSAVEIFVATQLSKGHARPHGPEEEFMEVLSVPFTEALDMVRDGRIRDSKTVFGLLLCARERPELVV